MVSLKNAIVSKNNFNKLLSNYKRSINMDTLIMDEKYENLETALIVLNHELIAWQKKINIIETMVDSLTQNIN